MEGYIAFADPEYSTNINVDLQGGDFFKIRSAEQIKELQSLSPLPETQKEITEVAKFFSDRNKKLLLGKSASELNFRLTDFTNYDFLHFAVHGLVSGNFSGLREPALALSVPDKVYSRMNDGLLTESEISEFDFTGKHIFLSACKTAADFGAQVNSGFEGIASAFLLAGAAEVFATQWDIESLSAVDIVTQYLENFTIKEQKCVRFEICPVRLCEKNKSTSIFLGALFTV